MCVSLYSDLGIAYDSPKLITQTISANMRGINPPTVKSVRNKSEKFKGANANKPHPPHSHH